MDIEIEESIAVDDSCQFKLWCQGHFENEEFISAVHDHMEKERENKDYHWSYSDIKRGWWRIVPIKNEVCDFQYLEAEKGKQGAFPVTVLDKWYPMF